MAHSSPAAIHLVEPHILLADGRVEANRHDHKAERQRASPYRVGHLPREILSGAHRHSALRWREANACLGDCALLLVSESRSSADAPGPARAAGSNGPGLCTYFAFRTAVAARSPTSWSRAANARPAAGAGSRRWSAL